ncbi:MAG: hypothetical protein ABIZ04_06780 [Opitutus sp.]
MSTLRIILTYVTLLATAGFCALIVFGDGFRRSFGASENSGWKVAVILLVQAALLASLAMPKQRMVLHAVAVVLIGLLAGSFWLFRQSAFVGLTGVGYCGLWLGYYYQAVTPVR